MSVSHGGLSTYLYYKGTPCAQDEKDEKFWIRSRCTATEEGIVANVCVGLGAERMEVMTSTPKTLWSQEANQSAVWAECLRKSSSDTFKYFAPVLFVFDFTHFTQKTHTGWCYGTRKHKSTAFKSWKHPRLALRLPLLVLGSGDEGLRRTRASEEVPA